MARPKSEKSEATRDAERKNKARAEERNVKIPLIRNARRRAKCEDDPLLFLKTYLSQKPSPAKMPGKNGWFHGEFSEIHIELVEHLRERILYGGLEAFVAPRGFGKDTIAKGMVMWATFYGHTRFAVYACYEAGKADDAINSIKEQIELNELLAEDFPEICYPARALNRAPQRAKLQTFAGEHTRMEWGSTIILPSVKGRPCSGNIIAPGSLGGSIRGLNVNGERPTFVVISDPQTRETAKSTEQCEKIESTINADFGGLGSHLEPLACLALMTIIRKGDVADRLTDKETNPQWNGKRTRAMIQMPKHMEVWQEYFEMMSDNARLSRDSSHRNANEFYRDNRELMDDGAIAAWPDGYIKRPSKDGTPLETSAVQHLMNWMWKNGEEAFLAECQGEPVDKDAHTGINAQLVCSRINGLPAMVAPRGTKLLVQTIDVRAREIHYAVTALDDHGGGAVIDFGILEVFAPKGNLAKAAGALKQALELAILKALRARREEMLLGSRYVDADGNRMAIALTLVDSGWHPRPVYIFVKESGSRWRAAKGEQAKVGRKRFLMPKRSKLHQPGDQWCASWQAASSPRTWLYLLNADHWKLHVHERFAQDPGTPGALTIFGTDPRNRELMKFANHICAERWNLEKNRFDDESRYNHWLDCMAGCFAAGNMMGIDLLKSQSPVGARRSVNLDEYFSRKKKERTRLFA